MSRIEWAFCRLVRIDSSLLGFLTLFLPLWARSRQIEESAWRALPFLFIWICTFVANDLDDKDRDEINHPDRPLPRGEITPTAAACIYFCALAAALISIKELIAFDQAVWYYTILAIFISYHYVVEHVAELKAPYVAAGITAPILVLYKFCPGEIRLLSIAGSAFCFALCRELCMDLLDRRGDRESALTSMKPSTVAVGAFAAQMAGTVQVFDLAASKLDWLVFIGLSVATLGSIICWFVLDRRRLATMVMKGQFVLGLLLLL